jgi:hypothetical protein
MTVYMEAAIDAILSGSLGQPLQRIVDAAAHIAQASGAVLTVRRGSVDVVLAARGIPLSAHQATLPALPGTSIVLGQARVIPDISRDPLFACHPLATEGARWRWAALVPVQIPGMPASAMLTCGDPRMNVARPDDFLQRLQRVAAIVADEIELIGEIAVLTRTAQDAAHAGSGVQHSFPELPLLRQSAESPAVVTDFLLSTLIPQSRLLRRGNVPYHALTKWRTSLKAWQIAALRALKRDAPAVLVDRIATDLADAARALYGTGTFQAVVAVPCGNSGDGCLAARLSEATAARLDVPVLSAFASIAVTGSSHPRRNTRRPAMTLTHRVEVPVLLIDDVATSGAHIEEAALLLRETAPAVLPLVWIGN